MKLKALALSLVAGALLAGCEPTGRDRVRDRFVDMTEVDAEGLGRFEGAVAGAGGPARARDVSIHGDRRPALVLEPPSRVSLRADPGATRLRFAVAVRPPEAPVTLRVTVDGATAHEETWNGERDWREREVSLGTPTGEPKAVEIDLDGAGATVMLAEPQSLGEPLPGEPPRPNVIVYVVDCLRADHVGAYGYPLPTTPSLDALAGDSVLLADLNACAPWTKPSTGCLFTSLLPTYHRARTVDDALAQERTTLAELFQAEGYRTLAWVANPVIDPRLFAFNQGFDRWVDLRSFAERSGGSHINALDPDAAQITEEVVPWLREHREERFFLYLHSLDLHYEYRPRPPFDREFVSATSTGLERDRELYDNELAYNDREIGRLVDALRELDLYDDTLLLVTADHGEEFGEHGTTRHGKSLYQQLLHIPGILKLPGSRAAGRRVEAVASNIDLAPTLLELAGAPASDELQGRSLVPVIERSAASSSRPVFAEVMAPQYVSYTVRDERYKLVKTLVPEVGEALFDLASDPGEREDLSASPPPAARALGPELDRFLQLGQHGFHLSVLGKPEGARMRVELSTEATATFQSAFRFAIETGDVLETSLDGRRVVLSFTADPMRRHLVLQTEPEGAPVSVAISADGEPVDPAEIRLGVNGTPASGRPISGEAVNVSLSEAERLLKDPGSAMRLWHVPFAAGGHRVELDDETLRTLRALGYVQ